MRVYVCVCVRACVRVYVCVCVCVCMRACEVNVKLVSVFNTRVCTNDIHTTHMYIWLQHVYLIKSLNNYVTNTKII